MGWLLLGGAIVAEVSGTIALRQSAGFHQPQAVGVVLACYLLSFYLLARTLQHVALSVAYAVWAGVGTALVALAASVLFHERMSPAKAGGLLLIVVGVVVLNLGGSTHA